MDLPGLVDISSLPAYGHAHQFCGDMESDLLQPRIQDTMVALLLLVVLQDSNGEFDMMESITTADLELK